VNLQFLYTSKFKFPKVHFQETIHGLTEAGLNLDGHDHRPSSITELRNGDADMASGPGFELDVSLALPCHSVT